MKTVSEISKLTGVSVRALHHYDAIGLLKPAAVTEAGYRLYDDASLERLQSILLLRELEFPLAEIGRILDNPSFSAREALADQLRLLEMRRQKLSKLIDLTKALMDKGEGTMDFSAFKNDEYEKFTREAKEKWGGTAAYSEYDSRLKKNGAAAMDAAGRELTERLAAFGELKGGDPAGEAAQTAVSALQSFITANFYTCTDEVLLGLGEMYVGDGRFKKNIDEAGGEGTAEFIRSAIRAKAAKK